MIKLRVNNVYSIVMNYISDCGVKSMAIIALVHCICFNAFSMEELQYQNNCQNSRQRVGINNLSQDQDRSYSTQETDTNVNNDWSTIPSCTINEFFTACTHGCLDTVQHLTLCYPNIVHARNATGYDPLAVASCHGHLEIVQFLVEHNASVNSHTEYGVCALHFAAMRNHPDIVEYLIDCGANV